MDNQTMSVEMEKFLSPLKERHSDFTTAMFKAIEEAYKLGVEHGVKIASQK